MPSKIIKGLTTIIWGSDNVLGSPAGAIVESGSITPKNGEPIEIEDNQGFAAVEILLVDGFNAKISCLYDTAKTWPAEGSNVVLTLPMGTGNANTPTTPYTCLLVSQAPSVARKKEAMIELNLTYRPGVSV